MPSKFPCLGRKRLKYNATYPCSKGFLQSFIKLRSHKNGRLKKYLLESLEERKKMRTSTLLAIAGARHYEAEFESIQSEWNRNNRVRHMMLTLWPEDEKMYPITWDDQDPPLTLRSGSINWKQVEEEDHHWDVEQTHVSGHMAGHKLWPNPHSMVSDGSRCIVCQAPFGPEGCFQVGSCGAQFHPHCRITHMIKRR